jgi:hypothetical protein
VRSRILFEIASSIKQEKKIMTQQTRLWELSEEIQQLENAVSPSASAAAPLST